MNKYCQILLLSLLFFFTAYQIYGQEKDFGLWTAIEIEKKLLKNLELDFGLENRLLDNLNQRDETFIDTDLSYRYGILAAGVGYRFTNNKEVERNFGYSHRFHSQFRIRPEWKRFSFDYRIRYQSQYFNINTSENGKIPENFIRNKLKISYNIRKNPLEPNISFEYFYRLDQQGQNKIQRRRLSMGMEYKINKDNFIEISYIIHETVNVKSPLQRHIIGLNYKLQI